MVYLQLSLSLSERGADVEFLAYLNLFAFTFKIVKLARTITQIVGLLGDKHILYLDAIKTGDHDVSTLEMAFL